MPRRYNLRQRDKNVKWVEDETLKEKEEESESEDEDYEPPSEDEESEDEELDDEDESESEEESEEEGGTKNITIPLPKNGRIKIEIDNRRGAEVYSDGESESEEEEEDGFIGYLMDKYAPRGNSLRMKKPPKKNDKESEDSPLMLNDEEQDYYDELTRSKRKKLNKHMKQIQALVAEGDVPRKFRILELPIPDPIKASVIKKLDMLDQMEEEGGGDTHKLRSWIDGFMRIPFGQIVALPVKLDDGPKPCSDFLAQTRKTLDGAVYGMNGAKTQIFIRFKGITPATRKLPDTWLKMVLGQRAAG
jgi:hypothetical protein